MTFDFPAIVPENARTLIPVLKFLHFTDWFPTDIDLLIDDYLFLVYTADLVLLQNKGLEGLKVRRVSRALGLLVREGSLLDLLEYNKILAQFARDILVARAVFRGVF